MGGGLLQNKPSAISISCVRTVHVHAVCSGRTLPFLFLGSVGFLAMFVHIRQRVREQPDTGYRKWLTAYFAAALAVGGFWGSGLDLAAFGVV